MYESFMTRVTTIEKQWGSHLSERADSLIKRSHRTRTSAAKIARIMCELIDVDYHNTQTCLVGPIKTKERILEKAATDYSGNIESISDGCRLMLLFDDARTIERIRRNLISGKNKSPLEKLLKGTNFHIMGSPKDMISSPKKWGYMGYMLKFEPEKKLNLYTSFEVQITHRGLKDNYFPITHDLYESKRVVIENYENDNVPIEEWDEDTRAVVQQMLDLHREGAQRYGLMPYVKSWPTLRGHDLFEIEDDIEPLDYQPMALDL